MSRTAYFLPRWRNGRRGGLKIRFPLREWGFESLPGHQYIDSELLTSRQSETTLSAV